MARPKAIRNVPMGSALVGVLYILHQLDLFTTIDAQTKRGRPYVYSNITMLCCFVVMLWMKLGSVNALYAWLSQDYDFNAKARKACGLERLPDRRTFDRRFAALPFEDLIGLMGYQFVLRKLVDVVAVAIDSTILRARNGLVHHVKDKLAGRVPRPGIDTEAAWTRKLKRFFYGYKLHVITAAIPKMAVPLAACTTLANVADNKTAMRLISRIPLKFVRLVMGDQGYRDKKLFLDVCEIIDHMCGGGGKGALMTWTRKVAGVSNSGKAAKGKAAKGKAAKGKAAKGKAAKGKAGPPTRAELGRREMAKSDRRFATREGKKAYSSRKSSVEPAQGRLKRTFGMDPLPVRGAKQVNTYVLGCVFVYQAAIFYKCICKLKDPLKLNGTLLS